MICAPGQTHGVHTVIRGVNRAFEASHDTPMTLHPTSPRSRQMPATSWLSPRHTGPGVSLDAGRRPDVRRHPRLRTKRRTDGPGTAFQGDPLNSLHAGRSLLISTSDDISWGSRCHAKAKCRLEGAGMMKRSTKLVVTLGSLVLSSLTAGVGVASADPDLGPFVNTTCTYPQVVSALNAQSPDLAVQLAANPGAQSMLNVFLGSPVVVRQRLAQQVQGAVGPQYVGAIVQAANTCTNY